MLRFQAITGMSLPMKKILFLLTSLFASVVLAIFASSNAHAISGEWGENGNTIIVENKTYSKLPSENPRNKPDMVAYEYTQTKDGRTFSQMIFVDKKEPITDSSKGLLIIYEKIGSSYVEGPSAISLDLKKATTVDTEGKKEGQCTQAGSMSWILCPVAKWLSESVDSVYKVVSEFLEVEPFTRSNAAVYAVWSIILSIANICLAIVLIIMVYSQITSVGMSNYNIKDMIPRLIIGTVLANFSYIITALMVDASNILGYSIQSILASIADSINITMYGVDWGNATSAIITGGALTIGGASIVAAAGSGAAIFFMLISALVSVAFALIVAFVILAARQAIIVILVMIAPLAMIAFILPATQGLFDKWRKSFLTLLLFFPIFAFIFGASQLAGKVIISRAGEELHMVLIGMTITAIPLIITPLIIRFSSGILGQIANITNNTSKGPLDRVKNWSNGMSDYYKSKELGKDNSFRNAFLNPFAGVARTLDSRRRNRERRKTAYETLAEARSINTSDGYRSDEVKRRADDTQQIAQSNLDQADGERRVSHQPTRARTQQVYDSKHRADTVQKESDAMSQIAWQNRVSNSGALHSEIARADRVSREAKDLEALHEDELEQASLRSRINDEGVRRRAQAVYDSSRRTDGLKKQTEGTISKDFDDRVIQQQELFDEFTLYNRTDNEAKQSSDRLDDELKIDWHTKRLNSESKVQSELEASRSKRAAKLAESRGESISEQLVASNGDAEKIDLVLQQNADMLGIQENTKTKRDQFAANAEIKQLGQDSSTINIIRSAADQSKQLAENLQTSHVAEALNYNKDEKIAENEPVLMKDAEQNIDIQKFASGVYGKSGEAIVQAQAVDKYQQIYVKEKKARVDTMSAERRANFEQLEQEAINSDDYMAVNVNLEVLTSSGSKGKEFAAKAVKKRVRRIYKELQENPVGSDEYNKAQKQYEEIKEQVLFNNDLKASDRSLEVWSSSTEKHISREDYNALSQQEKRSAMNFKSIDEVGDTSKTWTGLNLNKFSGQTPEAQKIGLESTVIAYNENKNASDEEGKRIAEQAKQFLIDVKKQYESDPYFSRNLGADVKELFKMDSEGTESPFLGTEAESHFRQQRAKRQQEYND